MERSHGVAFWSVFWNGIKLDWGGGGGGVVANLYKYVNPG